MAAAIAWIDGPAGEGRWGEPAALGLPLHDRGLLLADGLRTMAVDRAYLSSLFLGSIRRSYSR